MIALTTIACAARSARGSAGLTGACAGREEGGGVRRPLREERPLLGERLSQQRHLAVVGRAPGQRPERGAVPRTGVARGAESAGAPRAPAPPRRTADRSAAPAPGAASSSPRAWRCRPRGWRRRRSASTGAATCAARTCRGCGDRARRPCPACRSCRCPTPPTGRPAGTASRCGPPIRRDSSPLAARALSRICSAVSRCTRAAGEQEVVGVARQRLG